MADIESKKWASNLSTVLKPWIPEHGYKTVTKLADELDIPRPTFGRIVRGEGVAEGTGQGELRIGGPIWYARINLWTRLPEADPRNLPDKLIKTPQGDVEVPIPRRWSDDEYQKWAKSSEAKDLIARRDARFKREMVMESKDTPQKTQTQAADTVGMFIGSFIDELIDRGAVQIAKKLLESQKDVILPYISSLEERISKIEKDIALGLAAVQSSADQASSRPSRIKASDDIGQAARHLEALLEGYTKGASEERDKLMQKYGRDLFALDAVVHTLTRLKEERERNLIIRKETKI